jgi:hypothetical protein
VTLHKTPVWGPFQPGDRVRIRQIRGQFIFRAHVRNDDGATWLDLYGPVKDGPNGDRLPTKAKLRCIPVGLVTPVKPDPEKPTAVSGEGLRGVDLDCQRLGERGHTCRNRDGDLVRLGQSCWTSARNDVLGRRQP